MNLTSYLSHVDNRVNGKALRKPDMNLVAKLDAMGVEVTDTNTHVVVNPVSGFAAPLDPFIAVLVNWTYKVYSTYDLNGSMNYRGTKVAIGTYDRIRMLVLLLDSKAYSNFLD